MKDIYINGFNQNIEIYNLITYLETSKNGYTQTLFFFMFQKYSLFFFPENIVEVFLHNFSFKMRILRY